MSGVVLSVMKTFQTFWKSHRQLVILATREGSSLQSLQIVLKYHFQVILRQQIHICNKYYKLMVEF